jgi:hypothetical protein
VDEPKNKGKMPREPAQVKFASGKSGAKNTETPGIKRIEWQPAVNGGHTFTHHFESSGSMGSYKDPEIHSFGPKDGAKVVKHLKKHLGIAFSDATGPAVNHEEPGA